MEYHGMPHQISTLAVFSAMSQNSPCVNKVVSMNGEFLGLNQWPHSLPKKDFAEISRR